MVNTLEKTFTDSFKTLPDSIKSEVLNKVELFKDYWLVYNDTQFTLELDGLEFTSKHEILEYLHTTDIELYITYAIQPTLRDAINTLNRGTKRFKESEVYELITGAVCSREYDLTKAKLWYSMNLSTDNIIYKLERNENNTVKFPSSVGGYYFKNIIEFSHFTQIEISDVRAYSFDYYILYYFFYKANNVGRFTLNNKTCYTLIELLNITGFALKEYNRDLNKVGNFENLIKYMKNNEVKYKNTAIYSIETYKSAFSFGKSKFPTERWAELQQLKTKGDINQIEKIIKEDILVRNRIKLWLTNDNTYDLTVLANYYKTTVSGLYSTIIKSHNYIEFKQNMKVVSNQFV